VRLRLVNIDDNEPVWITIAYIPVIATSQETAGEARESQRRTNIFQRVLYAALRSTIGASHGGAAINDQVGQQTLTAYPRILAYLCDQPEYVAVVCLKQCQCAHPCTSCMVNLEDTGSPEAVTVEERDVLDGLQNQWEATTHRLRNRESARLLDLQAKYSLNASMPGLACFAGLSTAPSLMYKMIGFDALHVRLSDCIPVTWVALRLGGLSLNTHAFQKGAVALTFCFLIWMCTSLYLFAKLTDPGPRRDAHARAWSNGGVPRYERGVQTAAKVAQGNHKRSLRPW